MAPPPASKHIFVITAEQREALLSSEYDPSLFRSLKGAFEEEGFVLVRGLLDEQLQRRLCDAGKAMADAPAHIKMFTSMEFGPVFNAEEPSFREASLNSAIPSLVAVLLGIEHKSETASSVRVLKDCFMAKGKEEKHCGWHVDDNVFWPTDSSSSGVNVWMALDDMPSKYGGGLAVSPRSHTAIWRQKAYATIGSTPILPPEGLTPKNNLMETIGRTCEMESLDKTLNQRIEESKLVLDYLPGDCLICHRWLFHRSVLVNQEGLEHYSDGSSLKRYTIRYERGSARLIRGVSLEPSILMNGENSGKCLDEVCQNDGPFYPQCWPPLDEEAYKHQLSGMEVLAKEALPAAQIKKGQVLTDMMATATKEKPSYS